VTVRSRTNVPRYLVNAVASVERPLYELEPLQATPTDRVVAGPEIVSRKVRKIAVGGH
jgi:hypothetical protein